MPRQELIRVAVIFEPGKGLRPVWFDRNRRQHQVKETTYRWQDRAGDKPLHHFSVTDGESLFELIYSPLEGVWTLVEQRPDP
ncbi:MAG: hypothetical protein C0614_06025 [Desulfuromonas sp.]|nr:MAG: hypothetical protein C0614_06025 [Desulfuromonas sp.]